MCMLCVCVCVCVKICARVLTIRACGPMCTQNGSACVLLGNIRVYVQHLRRVQEQVHDDNLSLSLALLRAAPWNFYTHNTLK
jgi:hypothetical protein